MEGFLVLASAINNEAPKLAVVVRAVKEVDVGAIAATIDTEPWFATGAGTDWRLLGMPRQVKQRVV